MKKNVKFLDSKSSHVIWANLASTYMCRSIQLFLSCIWMPTDLATYAEAYPAHVKLPMVVPMSSQLELTQLPPSWLLWPMLFLIMFLSPQNPLKDLNQSFPFIFQSLTVALEAHFLYFTLCTLPLTEFWGFIFSLCMRVWEKEIPALGLAHFLAQQHHRRIRYHHINIKERIVYFSLNWQEVVVWVSAVFFNLEMHMVLQE